MLNTEAGYVIIKDASLAILDVIGRIDDTKIVAPLYSAFHNLQRLVDINKLLNTILAEYGTKPLNITIDGDKWCAMHGTNPQEGVAGFGDTIESAVYDLLDNLRRES